jgi:hypothetical protein
MNRGLGDLLLLATADPPRQKSEISITKASGCGARDDSF